MSDKPIGPILDELGVTVDLDDGQHITDVVLFAKCTDLETGVVSLVISHNDTDWITMRGLHAAAGEILAATPAVEDDDD